MQATTDSAVFRFSDDGVVPHCSVRPCPTSHSTQLSSMPSIAGTSSWPPSLMVIGISS